ncbi:hypothetical protein HXX76_011463 [Chlamydomonas incerta]|uniref:Uncharacterized protein n=1 Tax=Chlamydomonas incerta TaxID=51695 RepID=A0A835SP87_CHLIN|nr:hypothetical protein HXX76_011463 [Chlamydomonas incerta]|eukprot:KAG2428762.1 hypothetical protein HXX76_011463 [Chlamydomonas incerta]
MQPGDATPAGGREDGAAASHPTVGGHGAGGGIDSAAPESRTAGPSPTWAASTAEVQPQQPAHSPPSDLRAVVEKQPAPASSAGDAGVRLAAAATAAVENPPAPPEGPVLLPGRLQLRQTLLVADRNIGWERVQPLCDAGASPAEKEELQELLAVWCTQWHCFPPWKHVLRAREWMLTAPQQHQHQQSSAAAQEQQQAKPDDEVPAATAAAAVVLWPDLSYPEKRMVVECYVHLKKAHNAAAGDLQAKATDLMRWCRPQQRPPCADADASDAATSTDAGNSSSPACFIATNRLWHFMRAHRVRNVGQEGVAPACRGAGDPGKGGPGQLDTHKPGFDGLDQLSGRNYNLTAQQVAERIIRPALEAVGGRLSYAEVYWGKDDEEERAPPATANGGEASKSKVPSRERLYVPYPQNIDFCDLAYAVMATGLKNSRATAWVEMFCSRRSAEPPLAAQTHATAATAAAGGLEGPQAVLPPPEVLQRCQHVGLVAGGAWPWVPLQPPPPLTDASCVVQLRAALAAPLKPLLLVRAYADVYTESRSNWGHPTTPGRDCLRLAMEAVAAAPAPLEVVAAAAVTQAASSRAAVEPEGMGQQRQIAAATDGQEQGPAAAQELWAVYGAAVQARKKQMDEYRSVYYPPRIAYKDALSPEPSWRPTAAAAAAAAPAGLRITRVLRVEGLLAPPATPAAPAALPALESQPAVVAVAEAGAPAVDGAAAAVATAAPLQAAAAAVPQQHQEQQEAVVLRTHVLDEQQLQCPPGMGQAEADELLRVWAEDWACTPDLYTVLRTWVACSAQPQQQQRQQQQQQQQKEEEEEDGRGVWAGMSWGERRAACELVLLYGPGAATWRPSAEAEAQARAASSRPDCVTVGFLKRFMDAHCLQADVYRKASGVGTHGKLDPYETLFSLPGQAVWNPRSAATTTASTSWVCANIVVPATKAYGSCYSDLFLSTPLQDKFLPSSGDRLCHPAATAKQPAFASHAWATRFSDFVGALQIKGVDAALEVSEEYPEPYWIDIFHKNQHQVVAVHDLSENLKAAGRVWCLFELMTAIQVEVPVRLYPSQPAYDGFQAMLEDDGGSAAWGANTKVSPQLLAEVDTLDVSTAQATVAADKDMILGMIRDSIGIDSMNAQVRAMFKRLLPEVSEYFRSIIVDRASQVACFAGDGIVGTVSGWQQPQELEAQQQAPAGGGAVAAGSGSRRGHCRRPQARPTRVADVRAGDWVVTAGGGVSRVVLLTVDPVGPEGVEVCALPARGSSGSSSGDSPGSSSRSSSGGPGHLLVTADHPVLLDGVWRLPRDVAPVQMLGPDRVPYGCVFNLELDPPAPLDVSGVVLVSLGQDTSGEARQGVDPASDALFGWGWAGNPDRARYLRQQEQLGCKRLAAGRDDGASAARML